MKKIAAVLGVALALTGCASQKIDDLPRVSPADAMLAFQQLGYGDWAKNPFIRMEAICGAKKVDVAFSDLRVASFSLRQSRLTLSVTNKGVCGGNHSFPLRDLDDARRMVSAAKSLGADFEYFFAVD